MNTEVAQVESYKEEINSQMLEDDTYIAISRSKDFSEINSFIEGALSDAIAERVLLLDGDGGVGKTWLLSNFFKSFTHTGVLDVHLDLDDPKFSNQSNALDLLWNLSWTLGKSAGIRCQRFNVLYLHYVSICNPGVQIRVPGFIASLIERGVASSDAVGGTNKAIGLVRENGLARDALNRIAELPDIGLLTTLKSWFGFISQDSVESALESFKPLRTVAAIYDSRVQCAGRQKLEHELGIESIFALDLADLQSHGFKAISADIIEWINADEHRSKKICLVLDGIENIVANKGNVLLPMSLAGVLDQVITASRYNNFISIVAGRIDGIRSWQDPILCNLAKSRRTSSYHLKGLDRDAAELFAFYVAKKYDRANMPWLHLMFAGPSRTEILDQVCAASLIFGGDNSDHYSPFRMKIVLSILNSERSTRPELLRFLSDRSYLEKYLKYLSRADLDVLQVVALCSEFNEPMFELLRRNHFLANVSKQDFPRIRDKWCKSLAINRDRYILERSIHEAVLTTIRSDAIDLERSRYVIDFLYRHHIKKLSSARNCAGKVNVEHIRSVFSRCLQDLVLWTESSLLNTAELTEMLIGIRDELDDDVGTIIDHKAYRAFLLKIIGNLFPGHLEPPLDGGLETVNTFRKTLLAYRHRNVSTIGLCILFSEIASVSSQLHAYSYSYATWQFLREAVSSDVLTHRVECQLAFSLFLLTAGQEVNSQEDFELLGLSCDEALDLVDRLFASADMYLIRYQCDRDLRHFASYVMHSMDAINLQARLGDLVPRNDFHSSHPSAHISRLTQFLQSIVAEIGYSNQDIDWMRAMSTAIHFLDQHLSLYPNHYQERPVMLQHQIELLKRMEGALIDHYGMDVDFFLVKQGLHWKMASAYAGLGAYGEAKWHVKRHRYLDCSLQSGSYTKLINGFLLSARTKHFLTLLKILKKRPGRRAQRHLKRVIQVIKRLAQIIESDNVLVNGHRAELKLLKQVH